MRWLTIGILSLAACFATAARGDIYQWEYIDPLQPELGRQQSSMLAPDGAGRDAVPGVALDGLDLTMAWLPDQIYTSASFWRSTLTNADLSHANLAHAHFDEAALTDADFTGASVHGSSFAATPPFWLRGRSIHSTASYQAGDLTGIDLSDNDLTGWSFTGQNLPDASFRSTTLPGPTLRGPT